MCAHTPERHSSSVLKRTRSHTSKPIVEAPEHSHNSDTTARDTVLHVSELLECVLSHLPPRNIFTLKRVSRFWKNTITASPELQEMMFLRPQLTKEALEVWEASDPEAKRVPVDRPDASPSAHYCDCKLKLRRVGLPREFNANHNDDDERKLFLPVALNPLMEKANCARRALVAADGQGVACSTAKLSTECVIYHGTIALLEQYPCMYLTDPPTLETDVAFIVYYRDADASLTATPVRAELLSITIESSAGVKMQDVLEEMLRGERFECDVFGPYDRRFKGRMFESGEWDKQRQRPTLAGVEELVRETYGWKRAVRDSIFELEIFLKAAVWKGLRPIVPTAGERRAVVGN